MCEYRTQYEVQCTRNHLHGWMLRCMSTLMGECNYVCITVCTCNRVCMHQCVLRVYISLHLCANAVVFTCNCEYIQLLEHIQLCNCVCNCVTTCMIVYVAVYGSEYCCVYALELICMHLCLPATAYMYSSMRCEAWSIAAVLKTPVTGKEEKPVTYTKCRWVWLHSTIPCRLCLSTQRVLDMLDAGGEYCNIPQAYMPHSTSSVDWKALPSPMAFRSEHTHVAHRHEVSNVRIEDPVVDSEVTCNSAHIGRGVGKTSCSRVSHERGQWGLIAAARNFEPESWW